MRSAKIGQHKEAIPKLRKPIGTLKGVKTLHIIMFVPGNRRTVGQDKGTHDAYRNCLLSPVISFGHVQALKLMGYTVYFKKPY